MRNILVLLLLTSYVSADSWLQAKFKRSEQRAEEIGVATGSIQATCGNGKIDSGEECDSASRVSHGKCEDCILTCDSGFPKRKTINPLDGNKRVCSDYVVNNDPCGKSAGSCAPGHEFDYNYRPSLGNRAWKCGSHICYEKSF